jgi:hypothetical protein
MGIYIGFNPQHPWPESASKQSGLAGSFPFVWKIWSDKYKGKIIYHRDAIIEGFFGCSFQIEEAPRKLSLPYDHKPPSFFDLSPPPPPDQLVGLVIHVFVSGTSLKEVNAMADWIGSLQKKD